MDYDYYFPYLIIGAGPAGLQMGYYLREQGQKYVILEANQSAGSFFEKMPRHRQLISINKIHTGHTDPEINLRWDWNSLLADQNGLRFRNFSRDYFPDAETMVEYLQVFAAYYDLNIRYESRVLSIRKEKDLFWIELTDGTRYAVRNLLLATGLFQAYIPDIPGIENSVPYNTMSIEPDDYANQRVLILGKGNSAFETANHLLGHAATLHLVSPTPVVPAWHSRYVGHLRSINAIFLDSYLLKSQNVLHNAEVLKIEATPCNTYQVSFKYNMVEKEEDEVLEYDRILNCTGFRFDASLFAEDCQPELTPCGRFPKMSSCWESTNIPNLYFMGTLMQMRDYKKKQSGFIHGFRYNIRFLAQYLAQKEQRQEYPHITLPLDAEVLTQHLIGHLNRNSGLWQQTGFLGDLLVPGKEGFGRYYSEWPVEFIHESLADQNRPYFVITLDFGPLGPEDNPLAVIRPHRDDATAAENSIFIHPVIRYYQGSELLAEHHVMEDVVAEWKDDVHMQPLQAFFAQQLQTLHISSQQEMAQV